LKLLVAVEINKQQIHCLKLLIPVKGCNTKC